MNLPDVWDRMQAGPRRLDPEATFGALVSWTERRIADGGCPGLAVGLSGTDSILAFMVCARAMERLGRADRVLGVHFGKPWPPPGKSEEKVAQMLSLNPGHAWMQRTVLPWLSAQVPGTLVCIDNSIDTASDYQRWAAMMARALQGADPRQPLQTGGTYWLVGTHNATERELMTYSNISSAVSMQPLVHLWKSEVLLICRWLGVPEAAIERSRQADCDCGRFDTAAANIEMVDALLMERRGELGRGWTQDRIGQDLAQELERFISEQIAYASFKRDIPYSPPQDTVLTCR